MIPVCTFESSDEAAERIWNAGLLLFDTLSEMPETGLYGHPLDFPAYCTASLLLTGDTTYVMNLIDHALCACETSHDLAHTLVWTLPLSIEDYLLYTRDYDTVKVWISRLEAIMEKVNTSCINHALDEALSIGSETVLLRIFGECGLPLRRAPLGRRISAFHEKYFSENLQLYCDVKNTPSLLLTTVVAAFGFVEDNAFDAVRTYLLDNTFEIPRDWYGLLYSALHNLEVDNTMYSCWLEGGAPLRNASPSQLMSLVALIRYIIGTDISLLGRGIECAAPCMPSYIAYRISLPVGKRYVLFEGDTSF